MTSVTMVEKSALNFFHRIDGEHYSPRFVPLLDRLDSIRTVKLKDILFEQVKTGHTPSTKNSLYYDPATIKFLKTDNLREDQIFLNDVHFISESGNLKISGSELHENDVIVTIIGATEDIIGRAARIFPDLGRANINQNIALIRSKIPSGYLSIFLNCYYGREQLIWLSRQTEQVNLNCREVENIRIPQLSNDFTRTIHRLNSNRHNLLLESVQVYSRAQNLLLAEMGLQDWIPLHTLTYSQNYSKISQKQRLDAEHYQPKYETMFDSINRDVQLDPLGKITTFIKGIEVGSSAYEEVGVPFWRVSNLDKSGLIKSNLNYISEDLYNSLRSDFEPQRGELLLSKDATPGIAYYLENPIRGIISSGILRLLINSDISPHYLEIVLNSPFVQMQIEQDAGGSIIMHWKPSKVEKTLIPRLSNDKEREIATLVQQSHSKRRNAMALFEKAKRAVEIAIDENEENAIRYFNFSS